MTGSGAAPVTKSGDFQRKLRPSPPAEGFDTQRPSAGKQVQYQAAGHLPPQNIENGFSHPIGGGRIRPLTPVKRRPLRRPPIILKFQDRRPRLGRSNPRPPWRQCSLPGKPNKNLGFFVGPVGNMLLHRRRQRIYDFLKWLGRQFDVFFILRGPGPSSWP